MKAKSKGETKSLNCGFWLLYIFLTTTQNNCLALDTADSIKQTFSWPSDRISEMGII